MANTDFSSILHYLMAQRRRALRLITHHYRVQRVLLGQCDSNAWVSRPGGFRDNSHHSFEPVTETVGSADIECSMNIMSVLHI